VIINIVCISHNVSKSYLGNIWHVLIQNIQEEILYIYFLVSVICLLVAILEMAATAARGQFGSGSTPKFVHYILVYLCTKIGAFIKKCTIG